MNKIAVEIDGYIFYTTVSHYSPAVKGEYSPNSQSFQDYYGCNASLYWECLYVEGLDVYETTTGVVNAYDEQITEKLLDIMVERGEARKLNAEDYKERMKNY